MEYEEYMSKVYRVKEMKLSKYEKIWLNIAMRYEYKKGQFSIWDISKECYKKDYKSKYKVTHNGIQKLFSLQLVEEVEGKFSRGKRVYILSTNGWFNAILNDLFYSSYNTQIIEKFYETNIFFKTFLYPYFELSTIKAIQSLLFVNYLKECCETTIQLLYERNLDKATPDQIEQIFRNFGYDELESVIHSFLLKLLIDMTNMHNSYKNKTFSAKIVSKEGKIIDSRIAKWDGGYLKILSNDKKFLVSMEKTKKKFLECYKDVLNFKG